MDSPYKTDEELRDAGFLALREVLGPADALRFIRLYRPGAGDYTEERVLYVGDPTFEELMQELEQMRKSAGASEPSGSENGAPGSLAGSVPSEQMSKT